MKVLKIALILIISLITQTQLCQAQYEKYYMADNQTHVTTLPKATLYELPDNYRASLEKKSRLHEYSDREVVDINNLKTSKLRKPQQLKVLRYTNTQKQELFNAYIVEHKDKLWVLPECNAQDNTHLRIRGDKMLEDKVALESRHENQIAYVDSLKSELESLVAIYTKECTDSLGYYRDLLARLPQMRDSMVLAAEAQERDRVNKEYNKWYNSLPASTRAAAKILKINDAKLDYPNYAGGCDFIFYYVNRSPKTIKYLHWSGNIYNAVDDYVFCDIRRTSSASGKDTGPIAHEEQGGGVWDCVIYNYDADYIKLNNIRIIYMDGSSADIAKADIQRLLNEPSKEVHVDEAEVTSKLISVRDCQYKINTWANRLDYLNNKSFSKGYQKKFYADNSYYTIWQLLKEREALVNNAQAEADKTKEEADSFNRFINFEKNINTNNTTSHSGNKNTSYNNKSTGKSTKKNPFVAVGVDGSIEGLKSLSLGGGLALRIGRFDSLFNAIIGIRYQYTGYKKWVSYSYSENYNYTYSYADYKRKVNQLVVPVTINWNFFRDDFVFYVGFGYEYGFMLSDRDEFIYDFGDEFIESDFHKYSDDKIANLSVPAKSVVVQLGYSGRHWDWRIYYKIHAEAHLLPNAEKGSVGTAFTYYF